MNKTKLLFVGDDVSFSNITKISLELDGKYEVQTTLHGEEGLEMFHSFCPDVVVVDAEMQVMDGMEMIKKIRNKDEYVPILLASGQTNVQNVLNGYKLNIDNFIKKPYVPAELDAHIQAILRRIKNSIIIHGKKDTVFIGEYIFNKEKQILQYRNIIQKLTDRETQILEMLYEQKGNLVFRQDILKELWGKSDFFTSRSLDVSICGLRKLVSHDPNIKIETIRGKGFLFQVPED